MNKFGIDVSFWDGIVNWEKAKVRVDFAFIKAFEYVKDSKFDAQWNAAAGHVARGAYYFWRQGTELAMRQRTEEFLKVIGGNKYDGELPVVIDLEDSKAIQSQVFGQIDTLSERIKQTTGRYPIIYTGMNYWQTTCANKASQAWCDAHPLWISLPNIDYKASFEQEYQEILTGKKLPFIPQVPKFKAAEFIQWTYRGKPTDIPGYPLFQADGSPGKKAIDFNLFLGSEARYKELTSNFNNIEIPITDNYTLEQKIEILWKDYQSRTTTL